MITPSRSSISSISRFSACNQERAGPFGAVATDLSLPCQGQKRGTLLLVDEGWEDEHERVLAYHLDFLARALRHAESANLRQHNAWAVSLSQGLSRK